jgi:hypothetical protein
LKDNHGCGGDNDEIDIDVIFQFDESEQTIIHRMEKSVVLGDADLSVIT